MGRACLILLSSVVVLSACIAPPGARRAATGAAAQLAAVAPACALPPIRDSVIVSVVATVAAVDTTVAIPREFADRLVFELGRRLRLPSVLPVDTYADVQLTGPPITRHDAGFRALSAVVEMRLRRDGPPDRLVLRASSLSPAFDAALDRAVGRLVADGVGALPDSIPAPVAAQLTVETRLHPAPEQQVLFEMRSPLVRFESFARPRPGNPLPTHPRELRERGVEGDVKVQFVISPEGFVEPGTIRVVQADDEAFSEAVAAAMLFSRFEPARVGPCPIASIMELWYHFALR